MSIPRWAPENYDAGAELDEVRKGTIRTREVEVTDKVVEGCGT